ncbi:MAG: hypothetical protein MUF31_06125 [Akkermansiaceae bacterium]|nr:hypothetical protein [Akkermansiaceae bacterium]
MIDDAAGLVALLGEFSGDRICAVDTEADSLHRYKESLCLIQFAVPSRSVLIDPLAIPDLHGLAEYLDDRTVWMHGADYDMTMLRREFGKIPGKVYDTQIGARLLGLRQFGLANLVEHYFGVVLSKSSQKADWGKRPLSEKMVEYALNDVRYLLPMAAMIEEQLTTAGRLDWFVESCESARSKVLERDEDKEDPWRIQGSGRLDRRGLHFLKNLWEWRDEEAKRWDRPSFMVATNRQLLEWSGSLATGQRIEWPSHFRPDRRRRLSLSLEACQKTDADQYPEKVRGKRLRRDKDFDRRVDDLIARRNRVAEELGLEGSVIAPRAALEAIAGADDGHEESLMQWQRVVLGME